MILQPPARLVRGMPLGLIGMLALVIATERYIDRRRVDLGTMYALEWSMAGQTGRRFADAQVYCYGTSLTRLGVSPVVLEEKMGIPAYNFAMSGSQPYSLYIALRHALAAGGKPRAIVAEFKWSAIQHDHQWNERVFPEFGTAAECVEFGMAARDPDFLARLMLVKGIPSYRCRVEIQKNIRAALDGVEPQRNYEVAIMARNAQVNRGGNHTPKGTFDGAIQAGDPFIVDEKWVPDPMSEQYIDKFFALAESRGIPVFWLVPPISGALAQRRAQIGAEEKYTEFIKRIAGRHPGVSVVDARSSHFADEAFWDSTHLNFIGATALSSSLAAVLSDRLADPSARPPGLWVCLPEYRRASGLEAKVENLFQSLAALPRNDPMKRVR